MKRIRLNKLIATPLYGALAIIAQNEWLLFSKHFPSLSFACNTERKNFTDINYTSIIANKVSTTFQLPKR